LVRQLAERDEQIRMLKAQVQQRAESKGTDQPGSTVANVGLGLRQVNPHKTLDVEAAKTAAGKLGVTAEELEVARELYQALLNRADPKARAAAIEKLKALGDRRTAAVSALLRGITQGTVGGREIRGLLEAGFAEGQGRLIIDVVSDAVTPVWTKSNVLRNLDRIDTPAMRDYLVGRLADEEDRYLYADIAMTLGRMKEGRAVDSLARALERGKEWRPFHPYMLHALGNIGDAGAEGVLVTYLRREPRNLEDGLRALYKINPDAARGEAAVRLAKGARNEAEKAILRKYAER
jgi:HEAT repeat protein